MKNKTNNFKRIVINSSKILKNNSSIIKKLPLILALKMTKCRYRNRRGSLKIGGVHIILGTHAKLNLGVIIIMMGTILIGIESSDKKY